MKITCISDLHGYRPSLESGDVLIIAGDLLAYETESQVALFCSWLQCLHYKKIIVVAGNHDCFLYEMYRLGSAPIRGPFDIYNSDKVVYLCDEFYDYEGVRFYGSPWTLSFDGINPKCKAFTLESESEIAEKWALIDPSTDVLITHSPAYGIHDNISSDDENKVHVGSLTLRDFIENRFAGTLHICGHIHEGYGSQIKLFEDYSIQFVNASYVNERYQPVNKPIRITI